MSKVTITRIDNGYILDYVTEEEMAEHEEAITAHSDESEYSDLEAGEKLLWWIMDYFGFGGSKHDAERIRIVRVKRDAPEEE